MEEDIVGELAQPEFDERREPAPYRQLSHSGSRGVGAQVVPMVYRDIEDVMAAQSDLVQTLARFHPRIVEMAPAGERPED